MGFAASRFRGIERHTGDCPHRLTWSGRCSSRRWASGRPLGAVCIYCAHPVRQSPDLLFLNCCLALFGGGYWSFRSKAVCIHCRTAWLFICQWYIRAKGLMPLQLSANRGGRRQGRKLRRPASGWLSNPIPNSPHRLFSLVSRRLEPISQSTCFRCQVQRPTNTTATVAS